jgi:hypothetical protein
MGKKGPKAVPMAALFKMEGKSPIFKQIKEGQEGLQKLSKTEKGRKAVKAMGYTEDVDGAMLMNKDYAAMMGGYKSAPVKMIDKESEQQTSYGKKHDRLRDRANKLEDKAMNYPGNKKVSDKKANRLLDRSTKLKNKARKIRNKA